DGRHIIVGVNAFTEGNDEPAPETLYIDGSVEDQQLKRLDAVRSERDTSRVEAALDRVRRDAADPEINLMPALLEASTAMVTLGEMMSAMADVFGRWDETPRI
ncbi:MAG: methylmalonyl-CoA mutase, partial [Microthrixaceae bacterium]|nr:methylmalonyl-CoA mutase [Microthrixaceae bacterium]